MNHFLLTIILVIIGLISLFSCSNDSTSNTPTTQKTISRDLASYFHSESILETYSLDLPNLKDSSYLFGSRPKASNDDCMIWLVYKKQTDSLYFCFPRMTGLNFEPYAVDSLVQAVRQSFNPNIPYHLQKGNRTRFLYIDQNISYEILDELLAKLKFYAPAPLNIRLVNSIKPEQSFSSFELDWAEDPLSIKIKEERAEMPPLPIPEPLDRPRTSIKPPPPPPPPPPPHLPLWFYILSQSDRVITLDITKDAKLIVDEDSTNLVAKTELFQVLKKNDKILQFQKRIHEEHLGTIHNPPNNPIIYIKPKENTSLKDFMAIWATVAKVNKEHWTSIKQTHAKEFRSMRKKAKHKIWRENSMFIFKHNEIEYQYLKSMKEEGVLKDFWKDNYADGTLNNFIYND